MTEWVTEWGGVASAQAQDLTFLQGPRRKLTFRSSQILGQSLSWWTLRGTGRSVWRGVGLLGEPGTA